MGYRTVHYKGASQYLSINIWTLEAYGTTRQTGIVLYPQDLEIMALLPTIDAIEQYIYMLQDERAAKFKEALTCILD